MIIKTQHDISALLLYGSHARGDHHSGSDIDVLGVIQDGRPALHEQGPVRLNVYSQSTLLGLASRGSLFIWHLVAEGRVLYDPYGQLALLFEEFSLRETYRDERLSAAVLGHLIIKEPCTEATDSIIRRTVVYSLRTILYSHLAEVRTPAFSETDVQAHFRDPEIERLWSLKHRSPILESDLRSFVQFLERYAEECPAWVHEPREQLEAHWADLPELARVRLGQVGQILVGYEAIDHLQASTAHDGRGHE